MSLRIVRWALAVFAGAVLAGSASAQYNPTPGYRPPGASLSPYLNLLRNQNNAAAPAANYYLGVIPERVNRRNARQFSADINTLETALLDTPDVIDPFDEEPDIGATGHPAVFLNTAGFFPQAGGRPTTNRTTGGPVPVRRPRTNYGRGR